MGERSYRIKGSGSTREVYDGALLVGTITRHEKDVVKIIERWRHGRLVSAEIRKAKKVTWTGTLISGGPVLLESGALVHKGTIKAWRSPAAWGMTND